MRVCLRVDGDYGKVEEIGSMAYSLSKKDLDKKIKHGLQVTTAATWFKNIAISAGRLQRHKFGEEGVRCVHAGREPHLRHPSCQHLDNQQPRRMRSTNCASWRQ